VIQNPGIQIFIIRIPLLTEKQISWAKANSIPRGRSHQIALGRNNGKTELNVTVPPNCTATIYFLRKGDNGARKNGLGK
jgi:alpha-L-rhamnosidase